MKEVKLSKLRALTLKVVNIALLVGLISGGGFVWADDADEADKPAATDQKPASSDGKASGKPDLAEQATNPTSPLMSLRLQDAFTTSYHNADSYGNAALFQGVFPTPLGWGKYAEAMINRWTMPYVTTPKIPGVSDDGRSVGFGDSLLNTWLIAPQKWGTFAWGTTVTLPTAGDNEFTGAGSWQAGPTAAFVNTTTPTWQWGFMVYQQWSFNKTRKNAKDVSILSFQPILTKHFGGGWYITLPDTPSSYDFNNKRWALNLGGAVGRVTNWGPQPIQLFAEAYYNPIHYNDAVSGKLTLKLNISFLMPSG